MKRVHTFFSLLPVLFSTLPLGLKIQLVLETETLITASLGGSSTFIQVPLAVVEVLSLTVPIISCWGTFNITAILLFSIQL